MREVEILPPPGPTVLPALPGPLLVTETGHVILPSMRPGGAFELTRLEQGVGLGWMPTPELGGLVLAISDGHARTPILATALTRPALQQVIEDLKSIDIQLGELGVR